jgi:squalene-hopene/tetraprenyl-beta-curcumene cyclase
VGLFHYYLLMAKALKLYGVEKIKSNGKEIDWREALGQKLVALQTKEGYWVNANERWWESNPLLTTSYAIIALKTIAESR